VFNSNHGTYLKTVAEEGMGVWDWKFQPVIVKGPKPCGSACDHLQVQSVPY
jgi:hypothetical protein